MTAEEFIRVAKALFGEGSTRFQKMAAALGNNPRRLRRMEKGELPIPDGLAEELRRMLEEKRDE
jgi:hypothetical protein